ncbi:fringe-like protein [Thalictrum thalictroides]|uniref:Fringe-like protein n=1 Tax=Thalictrum thalictroides TaxID=46969 RepID=A0A7J6V5U9_THATH|nr:fringe-like protein [Thalictrum thalictroides]
MSAIVAWCEKFIQKLCTLLEKVRGDLCKTLVIAGLLLFIIYIFHYNQPSDGQSTNYFNKFLFERHSKKIYTTTNISHVVFGIAGSANTWRVKRPYIDTWWRPNITRGLLWLERTPGAENLPWPSSSPPFRISEDIEKFKEYNRHGMRNAIRMARVILETFREMNKDVRWYVMTDDDTILFVDNLVELLGKYDHNKYYYIGENSECVASNYDYSFQMAFGGAGYALSFPLAKALVKHLDHCLMRYPTLYGSDHIVQSCIADLGVTLTHEQGFHQIDLHGDISGKLSAHPPVPLLSLHHLDYVEPIFPSMNRYEALNHLMEAATVDSSRPLQQSICYNKQSNWTFSISWGYSAQIYEKIHPPSFLERPLQTFYPWKGTGRPQYMFHPRPMSRDPCEAPHFFFFDLIEKAGGSEIISNYVRRSPRMLPACSQSGNHTADMIMRIRVFSPATRFNWIGRRECCDYIRVINKNVTEVKIRECMKDEIVA